MIQRSANPAVSPRTVTDFPKSEAYRAEIHGLIPGGAHTYSKGDDQFPRLAPAAMARGKGGRVWDIDGNEFVDTGLALGAVGLGHAYEPVLAAVREQLELGANFPRPASIERELAREMLEVMPGADRVKFGKNGSTVTTAAVKLSRAFTKRDLVAFPGNHPFYSYDDWFISHTLANNGVPDTFGALSVTYDSTRPETLAALFRKHPGRIACVITEPEDAILEPPDVIREVASITRRGGAVFILDEMVTGYRAGLPGAATTHGLQADLSTWGKTIGNGFSFAALTGRADIMELGGIKQRAEPRVFLISTTHGGEAHTLAAARAVLREYRTKNVIARKQELVAVVAAGLRSAVAKESLDAYLNVHASPWRVMVLCRDNEGAISPDFRALLLQEMIGRGVLFPGYFLPCFEHTDADVEAVVRAFEASCRVYKHALEAGLDDVLVGEGSRPVFRKYNECRVLCPSRPCPLEPSCRGQAGA